MRPVTGRSLIVWRCRTTSSRKRPARNPRSSREKVLGAAAISWTRRASCAAKAPMNTSSRIQNASVCMFTTINAETAEHAERKCSLRVPRVLRALSLFLHRLDDRRHDLEQVADDAVVRDLEDRRVRILVD